MIPKRVIPVLLLKNTGLYKTRRFDKPVYIGDPINALKIFNEKEVDELVILDITATATNKAPNFEYLRDLSSECFMPLAYGGGINKYEQAAKLFELGIEKIALNNSAIENPNLIKEITSVYGNQSVIVSLDTFCALAIYVLTQKIKISSVIFNFIVPFSICPKLTFFSKSTK